MTMCSQRILFADDDVLTQWIMTEVLTHAGFSVASACRTTEALDLLNGSAEFDLLLTDLDLPDTVNGHELADHWHRTLPGCPVIYTTTRRGLVVPVLEQHEYVIEKPFGAAKLLRLIDWALEEASFRPFMPACARRGQHVH